MPCSKYFNSIKVRLEHLKGLDTNKYRIYFNSIKVRLERTLCRQFNQFIVFQFHKGAIRTAVLAAVLTAVLDFNSIKVRLEPR